MQNYWKILPPSLCLLILMIGIHLNLTNKLDTSMYQWLHNTFTSDVVERYLEIISDVFSPLNCLILILLILSVLFFVNKFKFWWYGFWCFCVLLIGTFLKNIIQRPRPSISIDGYSFPSMHVLSVCLLVSLILLLKRNSILYVMGLALIVSIMISRIYLQAHYFTDTLGSLCVLWAMLQALQIARQSDERFYSVFSKKSVQQHNIS
ncbi:phosphatase PAP2 family protein [Staphylococcus gallinarum]|uniref:Phosphatase PAP2 family protein n=1 Tax=Staphylococcus gallinarum TaxID=1293 RepID=A0A3A0VKM4_STAGA|nr:phosphatase PAP2 family protein [Staphylococcus gallinarum]RIP34808.1 phosphatase PAP2 family protein [Staphylococcus gallinarum]